MDSGNAAVVCNNNNDTHIQWTKVNDDDKQSMFLSSFATPPSTPPPASTTSSCSTITTTKRTKSPKSPLSRSRKTQKQGAAHTYVCRVDPACGKTFRDASTRTRHEKVHSSMRYPCKVCGVQYSRKDNRNRHEIKCNRAPTPPPTPTSTHHSSTATSHTSQNVNPNTGAATLTPQLNKTINKPIKITTTTTTKATTTKKIRTDHDTKHHSTTTTIKRRKNKHHLEDTAGKSVKSLPKLLQKPTSKLSNITKDSTSSTKRKGWARKRAYMMNGVLHIICGSPLQFSTNSGGDVSSMDRKNTLVKRWPEESITNTSNSARATFQNKTPRLSFSCNSIDLHF